MRLGPSELMLGQVKTLGTTGMLCVRRRVLRVRVQHYVVCSCQIDVKI